MSEYAIRFGADPAQWLFLTGDLTYLRRVGAEIYQLGVDKKFHSEKFVLVDREGKIVGHYSWNDPEQWKTLRGKIKELLAEEA
jgi:protein SCO1/2